ncbi:Gamma-glutamyltransferase [Candidatus Terasakiella magnetica]|uniref:Glutathione hydrolase proenzyme n=1 Tax=Candidatus Terasakiella magnetica TaxID=1867952 RepID=A0A1C3RGQ8_9PROT|nr:gamma-glutamyltransferase [Candidatus Terasakiella magnetica]SCA56460.1 Gamma-glutamyltransferase [Candidatus Terasakiella magnetica]
MLFISPTRFKVGFMASMASAFLLMACAPAHQKDHRATPESAHGRTLKPLVKSQKAMISVANPLAAQAGYKILRAGGTAIDAAITAQMVLNLVEPQSSGIGGGGFLLVYDPHTKKIISYDGRETAPKKVTPSLFLKENGEKMAFFEATVGGRAVGIPGLLKMLQLAHQDYGRLDWSLLFEDGAQLAEKGFPVSPRLHHLLKKDRFLKKDPIAKAYFYNKSAQPHPVGHLLKNPAFAQSLRQIQSGGVDSFYFGQLADKIVDKVTSHPTNPGLLSHGDLMSYKAIKRAPVCLDYRSYHICGMAPPSSGGLSVLQTLGLMEKYDLNNDPKPLIDRTHLFLEASKLAFSDRNHFIADPDFVKVPTDELLASNYLIGRQTLIQHNQTLKTPVPAGGPLLYRQAFAPDNTEHGLSTTHMSIVDSQGMVVSMTTSIENAFGARQMVGGFLLNNQLTDFSFLPEKNGVKIANRVEPLKRPRSSMAPTIVLDQETKRPVLTIGSPGGSRIIGYVAQSLIAVLDEKKPLDQAIAQGHMTNRNGATELEKGTEAAHNRAQLEALGHQVKLKDMTSGLHAIQILQDGRLAGAADPRREGVVLGY